MNKTGEKIFIFGFFNITMSLKCTSVYDSIFFINSNNIMSTPSRKY